MLFIVSGLVDWKWALSSWWNQKWVNPKCRWDAKNSGQMACLQFFGSSILIDFFGQKHGFGLVRARSIFVREVPLHPLTTTLRVKLWLSSWFLFVFLLIRKKWLQFASHFVLYRNRKLWGVGHLKKGGGWGMEISSVCCARLSGLTRIV